MRDSGLGGTSLTIPAHRKLDLVVELLLKIKLWLNDQTFSSNVVFVTQTVGWFNGQTMFDQTSDKVCTYNALCVSPLKIMTRLFSNGGCLSLLAQALLGRGDRGFEPPASRTL